MTITTRGKEVSVQLLERRAELLGAMRAEGGTAFEAVRRLEEMVLTGELEARIEGEKLMVRLGRTSRKGDGDFAILSSRSDERIVELVCLATALQDDWVARHRPSNQYAKQAARRGLVVPPGSRLLSVVEFVFSPKTAKLLGQPIADLQVEYCEALGGGRGRKAGWVRLRGYWSFWKTLVMLMPVSLMRLVVQLWKISGGG